MKPIFRVIFDLSSFHGPSFELLRASRMLDLCRRGIIAVYHTPVFIEEVLQGLFSSTAIVRREQLSFAIDICNGGYFLEKQHIWRNELIAGRGPLARHLLPERHNWRLETNRSGLVSALRVKAATGDMTEEARLSVELRASEEIKKLNQRAIALGMRAEASAALKRVGFRGSMESYSFRDFQRIARVKLGKAMMGIVSKQRTEILADQWASNPTRYPFYSGFIDGLMYANFRATAEHRKPIDVNAQADYEQLAYLIWADIFVSNDRKFMRDAFDVVWKPHGKRFESTETFVDLIGRLSQ